MSTLESAWVQNCLRSTAEWLAWHWPSRFHIGPACITAKYKPKSDVVGLYKRLPAEGVS